MLWNGWVFNIEVSAPVGKQAASVAYSQIQSAFIELPIIKRFQTLELPIANCLLPISERNLSEVAIIKHLRIFGVANMES